jgi:hypothetical protein
MRPRLDQEKLNFMALYNRYAQIIPTHGYVLGYSPYIGIR